MFIATICHIRGGAYKPYHLSFKPSQLQMVAMGCKTESKSGKYLNSAHCSDEADEAVSNWINILSSNTLLSRMGQLHMGGQPWPSTHAIYKAVLLICLQNWRPYLVSCWERWNWCWRKTFIPIKQCLASLFRDYWQNYCIWNLQEPHCTTPYAEWSFL